MVRVHTTSSSGLTLDWALAQLRKSQQLQGSFGDAVAAVRRGGSGLGAPPGAASHLGVAPAAPECSSGGSLNCATPTNSDTSSTAAAASRMSGTHTSSARGAGPLSVHWPPEEALAQPCAAPHAPQHTHHAPEKPCLKPQQSSFPYLEEAAQLEGPTRRPWAASPAPAHGHALAKRSRLAAFGQ